jgi:glycyl-tRNA synthetase alpha chain
VKYGDVRLADELQFSVYNFEAADVASAWKHFDLYEAECTALIERLGVLKKDLALSRRLHTEPDAGAGYLREQARFPLLAAYDLCLKCSHLFNILDARGAISVTERVGVIARVRALAVGIAKAWVEQQKLPVAEKSDDSASASKKKPKTSDEICLPA